MSRSAVIISLALALILALAALLLLRQPVSGPSGAGGAGGAGGSRLLDFDPARVRELRFSRSPAAAGGPEDRIVRAAADPGSWSLTVNGPGTPRSWPVSAVRVHSALRLLSETASDPPVGPRAILQDPATLTLGLDDGSTRTLAMSSNRLGGRNLAEVVGNPGHPDPLPTLIDGALYDALVTTGPRAWREEAPLPGLGPDVSRLTLTTPKGELVLARVRGHWRVQSPVAAPAEDSAVSHLVSQLAGLRIVRFMDDATPESIAAQLASPVATLTIESERRSLSGSDADAITRTTGIQRLMVGTPADAAEQTLLAAIEPEAPRVSPAAGPARWLPIALPKDALGAVSMDPAAYIAKRAVEMPAADVTGVTIRRSRHDPDEPAAVGYTRSVDGWSRLGSDGSATPISPEEATPIAAIIALLTAAPADSVAVAAPAADQPIAVITIASADGQEMVELLLRSGNVLVARRAGSPAPGGTAGASISRSYPPAAAAPIVPFLTAPR
jgi:hypothetical protein